jgi:hypothetical protein
MLQQYTRNGRKNTVSLLFVHTDEYFTPDIAFNRFRYHTCQVLGPFYSRPQYRRGGQGYPGEERRQLL